MKLADTGLQRQPFRTHGKPLVVVPYASQKAAIQFLNKIRFDDRGLGLFHGPPLSGKTSIIHRFAGMLPHEYPVAIVDGARTDSAAILKNILGQFGYDHGFNTTSERFSMIRVFAMQQAASGQAPVLIIENVHAMSPVLLEMLCELAEVTVNGTSALRIVLVSDRPMLPIVEAPAMQSISDRLTGKFLLKPLTRAETATYIHMKLESGGCNDPGAVVPMPVCARLHSASGGWPGVIDRLAMMALANAEQPPLRVDHIPQAAAIKPGTGGARQSAPELILTFRRKTLKRVSLDGPRLVIGRKEYCDLDIVHEWISRQHAILIRNGKSTVIVDLNSRNGTYVNGERVSSQVLINNDIISLGDHRIKFVDSLARRRMTVRGAGWDDTTLAESIKDFQKTLARRTGRS